MIIIISFNSFNHQEIHLLDTNLVTQKIKNKLENHLKQNEAGHVLLIEKYDFNKFYKSLSKGFIKSNFPINVENMIFVKEYDEDKYLINSW